MEAFLLTIVQGLLLIGIVKFILKSRKNSKFPPGPKLGFPILGHLPLLGKQPYKTLMAWRSTYGSIIGLWFGNQRAIVLNDPELIREALNSASLAGRPPLGLLREWGTALVTAEGIHHSEQRKFTLRQMKGYGFGSSSIEAKIQDVVLDTLQTLNSHVGKPLSIHGAFEKPAGKVVWDFLMDQQGKQEDNGFVQTLSLIARLLRENTTTVGIVMFLPWLETLFPKLSGKTHYRNTLKSIENFIQGRVDEHDKSREKTAPRDFVDAYMEQVSKTQDPASSFHPSHSAIVHLVRDLLVGASETVGTSLSWLFAYMVTWPDVQRKLQREIDDVVGQERYPSLNDRPKMPYTVALIYELLRFSSLLPLGTAHRAVEDTTFHGYHLPKGTIVIPNLYAAHFDKELWVDPEHFRPERFLDGSGKHVKRSENLMPFAVGKRMCPGGWREITFFGWPSRNDHDSKSV